MLSTGFPGRFHAFLRDFSMFDVNSGTFLWDFSLFQRRFWHVSHVSTGFLMILTSNLAWFPMISMISPAFDVESSMIPMTSPTLTSKLA